MGIWGSPLDEPTTAGHVSHSSAILGERSGRRRESPPFAPEVESLALEAQPSTVIRERAAMHSKRARETLLALARRAARVGRATAFANTTTFIWTRIARKAILPALGRRKSRIVFVGLREQLRRRLERKLFALLFDNRI